MPAALRMHLWAGFEQRILDMNVYLYIYNLHAFISNQFRRGIKDVNLRQVEGQKSYTLSHVFSKS